MIFDNEMVKPTSDRLELRTSLAKSDEREGTTLRKHIKFYRQYIVVAAVGSITQLLIFKQFYPFPDFTSDSFSYIDTAALKMPVNLWPIGYSWFLDFVHYMNHSDNFLIAIQYAIAQLSMCYFFFTISYLFILNKLSRLILFIFLLFNPISIYLSNCILSDSLFASISLILFSTWLWMFHKASKVSLYLQAILIGICFTLRYAAVLYPLLSIVVIAISNYSIRSKLAGSLAGLIPIVAFIFYTTEKTQEITGTRTFSVFGSWQLANNALYMYDRIKVNPIRLPANTRRLDSLTRNFFAATPDSDRQFSHFTGGYFLKVPSSPLKQYLFQKYRIIDAPSQFFGWAKVSPIYRDYGLNLIKENPVPFLRYFVIPNVRNYLLPPLEKFEFYNLFSHTVPPDVQDWFSYETPDVTAKSYTIQGKIFYPFQVLFLVLNGYFFGSLTWVIITRKARYIPTFLRLALLLTASYVVLNFLFSTASAPVVMRYQVMPLILLFVFAILVIQTPYAPNLKTIKSTKTK